MLQSVDGKGHSDGVSEGTRDGGTLVTVRTHMLPVF